MNLDITIGDLTIRLPSADLAAQVIPAFAAAQVFERHWNGTVEAKPEKAITFAFVDPSVTAENPAVAAARKEATENSQRWYKEHEAHQASQRRIAELEAKLAVYSPGAQP